MIITTTVKPFYGTTTRGSGLNRLIKTVDSLLDYALYVSFFPQLVAGPIIRAVDFLPQTQSQHRASAPEIGWGLCLFLIGLFQKVVIADTLMSPSVE